MKERNYGRNTCDIVLTSFWNGSRISLAGASARLRKSQKQISFEKLTKSQEKQKINRNNPKERGKERKFYHPKNQPFAMRLMCGQYKGSICWSLTFSLTLNPVKKSMRDCATAKE